MALTLLLTPTVWLTAAPAAPDDKDKTASPAEKIKKQLDQNISLEITEQPLTLALNQIREQTKINFVWSIKFTIQQLGLDPEQMPVNVKLKDVKVRTCLRSVLSPYNLGYAIIGDTVFISTDEMVMHRQLRQRVSIDLEKVDLATALKQLSRESATNVLLDSRVKDKDAKAEITLQMEDVPLETAVRLVCEMAGVKPVKVGNVLFVTTKALANEMRSDPDLTQPGQPGVNPVMPGGPGFPVPTVPPGVIQPGMGTIPELEKSVDPVDSDKKPVEEKKQPEPKRAEPESKR